MAARFWVGGTATWDSSNTASWAATSGGAGGVSVPTSADSVTFNANSGGGTVTCTAGQAICAGLTGTTTGGLTITGNLSASSNISLDGSVNSSGLNLSLGTAAPTIKSVSVATSLSTLTVALGYVANINANLTVGTLNDQGTCNLAVGITLTITTAVLTPASTGDLQTQAAGSQATITANIGDIVLEKFSSKDINYAGTSKWYKGNVFTDLGNNTNLKTLPKAAILCLGDF